MSIHGIAARRIAVAGSLHGPYTASRIRYAGQRYAPTVLDTAPGHVARLTSSDMVSDVKFHIKRHWANFM